MSGEIVKTQAIDYSLVQLAVENKDVFTTLILLFVFIILVLPLFYMIVKKMVDNVTASFKEVLNHLKEHHSTSVKGMIDLQQKIGNTVLNKEQTVSLLQEKMWFVSYGKLEFIKQVMLFNHIAGRREEIKNKIKNELDRRSEDYIKEFSKWITPIGDLSRWLQREFGPEEFDKFVEEIVDVVYRDSDSYKHMTKEVVVEIKKNDVATLMKDLQGKLAKKLREDLDNDNYVI